MVVSFFLFSFSDAVEQKEEDTPIEEVGGLVRLLAKAAARQIDNDGRLDEYGSVFHALGGEKRRDPGKQKSVGNA